MVFNTMKYLNKGLPYKTSKFMHNYYIGLKIVQRKKYFKNEPRHRRVSKLQSKEWLKAAPKDGEKLYRI